MKWKESPKIKIYEALTVLANDRVKVDGNSAKVSSSAGKRVYQVDYDPKEKTITSNDNGSYWQGYMGYPIIAYLLATGVVKYDPVAAELVKDFNWGFLNEQFKRKYDQVIAYVLSEVEKKGGDATLLKKAVADVSLQLSDLELQRTQSPHKPPS